MVSSLTSEGAQATLEALSNGAFDYVPKQLSYVSLDIIKIREDLISKVKAAAEAGRRSITLGAARAPVISAEPRFTTHVPPSIIAIGTSTGGPRALQEILPLFPADLPVSVLVVQHMPPGFTGPFARRLDNLCKISVREAMNEEVLDAGVVYIAPAGQHMTVYHRTASKYAIRLSQFPERTLHTPSVDVMMLSVAEAFRALSMGIIMTGMGADGLEGMRAILREGGITVGQDEASCIVWGMPRSCAEADVLQRVVSLRQIPEQILQSLRYRRHN
jgi:two-component system chemotaxis response regulator CheB